jgi:methionine biosynthesis protein MetW
MINKITSIFKYISEPLPLDNSFNNYNEYWMNRGFHQPSLARSKLMSRHIEPGSSILDVGCGDGTTLEYLKEHNKPKKLIGIDISSKAVEYVKSKGYDARVMDIFSENFNDFIKTENFDYIIISEVLEHVIDSEKVLILCKDHFNKALFVTIPNAGFFIHRLRLLFGKFPLVMIQQHVKEHIRFWTLNDFLYWVKYHRMKVLRYESSAGLHFRPLNFLDKLFPSLFAQQIIYQIIK